ncbi:bifunctional UDP-sugar hydrolase/5'-nucleotidase [Flammeovirgaceae bacterium SG7u.111]|nr:bifunctional UDP-sugar hydrolase/5'-nucleotidase [Flammeovirgaceae bacterium SG7u.132]WPO37127.1 bifunctional UDP-sugar hydrolase/5'-nucleotidase [Flammeovirgaceae bacterium SG7u.111]
MDKKSIVHNQIVILVFSLFFFVACQPKPSETISILYFNDAHEIAPVNDKYGNRGGVSRLKTIVDNIKERNDAIVLFGGDLAGGTLFGGIYHGFPMVEAFNEIPIDIANFGQHDFDFGVENTKKLIQKSNFQWFSSNLKDSIGNTFASLPESILIEKSNTKIGFIGLTDAMNTSIQEKNIIKQDELIKSAKKNVKRLQNKGAEIIIAITQSPISVNEILLSEVDGIDVIFTEEVSETKTVVHSSGKKTIIATCGNMGSLAEVTLYKEKHKIISKIQIHPLDTTIESNKELLVLEKKYMDSLDIKLSSSISYTNKNLLNEGSRESENLLGNLITNSFRDYHKADIGLINGGGIRGNIFKGEITLKEAHAVLPFGNKVCLVELNGLEIKDLINKSITDVNENGGDFLQVSGINYTYTMIKNSPSLLSVTINGKPIDEIEKYKVAMPSYILLGGGNFNNILQEKILVPPIQSPVDVEVFINYLKSHQEISLETEDRIKIMK